MKTAKVLIIVAMSGLTAVHVRAQGSLTPPGAPGATMKTLDQIEPRTPISNLPCTISAPGSYYVTTNLTGIAGTNGITICSDNIAVDLNGFVLMGVAASLDGVNVSGTRYNIAVRNGTLRNWGQRGVNAAGARNSQYKNLQVLTNGAEGLNIGRGSLVEDCTAQENVTTGIYARDGSVIKNCATYLNGGGGILGLWGIAVTACSAYLNTGEGIHVEGGCTVSDCVARENTRNGIYAAYGGLVRNCVAYQNSSNGVQGVFGTTITGCRTHYNKCDGIRVDEDCSVLNSSGKGDGYIGDGAGIHVTDADNRIEGNNVTDADRGIDVDAAGNLIIRNSASGNTTNYSITGIQTIGPIITATGTITNENPWANFEF